MGLFKSAQQKQIEERMLIRRAIGSIKTYIEKLSAAKRRYIEEAKRAKLQNIPSQYRLAKSGLLMAMRQAQVAEQLLLTMEMSAQLKDTAGITKEFASGMQSLSGEIDRINEGMNFSKTGKRVGKAVTSTQLNYEALEMFLEESGEAFSAAAGCEQGVGDELDAMIEGELLSDGSGGLTEDERDILERLKKLK